MSPAVVIAPYSDRWPCAFASEAAVLRGLFTGVPVAIEHIGSTAVPGMAAKPVIDILLGAPSLASIEARIPALVAHGYRYVPEHEAVLPQRRYFDKGQDVLQFHLHAVENASAFWREHIAFRDALRSDERIFSGYLELKRSLAASALSRADYTEAKAPFIQAVLAAIEAR